MSQKHTAQAALEGMLSPRPETAIDIEFMRVDLMAALGSIRTLEEVAHELVKIGEELEPKPENVAMYGHALIAEVCELMDEMNWKRWKSPKEIDRARVVDEFADVLAFLGMFLNMLNRLGFSDSELARGFLLKSARNVQRLRGHNPEYASAFKERNSGK